MGEVEWDRLGTLLLRLSFTLRKAEDKEHITNPLVKVLLKLVIVVQ